MTDCSYPDCDCGIQGCGRPSKPPMSGDDRRRCAVRALPLRGSQMSEHYRACPCPCGHRGCTDWHVWPVAALQGVNFTEEQAKAVAHLLNELVEEQADD